MGAECMGADSDVMPPAPPGFASLTSFTLQMVQDDVKLSVSTSDSIQNQKDTDCDTMGTEKFRKSLRHRPWVNYSQFDNCSEEESDPELFERDVPLKRRLPRGVLRGCAECRNCQKVTARWRPEDACRPVLDEAPVFYPSEEEFKDTLKYIASIRPSAEPYGICRIVPPPSWRPPCPLKENGVWENSKFATRIQQVDKLQNRDSVKKVGQYRSVMRKKRRRLLKMGGNNNENMMEINEFGCHNNVERFGFEPGPEFTLGSFQKYADDFKEQYFFLDADLDLSSSTRREPSFENIEGEYWRIVEKPTEEIEVLYGADLDTGTFGSGFPKLSSSLTNSDFEAEYLNSGWNLNNFPRLPGSVLCFERGDISGVLVPWLYVGMCFSSFCWHVEDHHLYSLNYLHWGAPKIWYGVPGRDALKLEAAMKKHLPDLFGEQPDLLHNLVTQFSPSLLKSEGVPVYRSVQHAGEFVLTFPRAYHSGFNCGFNGAEAVNVAPIDWLPQGQNAVELYREQGRKISISHDKLLLGAAREAVRAQWNISLLRKSTLDDVRWKNFCGLDGILAKALKARIEMERVRREYLCSSLSRKMDAGFDANTDRECFICNYDLHLSAANCPCSPERFTCLIHAKQLCSCAWSTRLFLFRYDLNELNILLDAVGGKLSAVHRWGLLDLGLSLSSYVTKDRAQESKLEGRIPKEAKQKENGPPIKCNLTDNVRSSSSQDNKASILRPSSAEIPKEGERGVLDVVDSSRTIADCSSLQQAKSSISSVLKEKGIRGQFLSEIVEDQRSGSREGYKSSNSVSASDQQLSSKAINTNLVEIISSGLVENSPLSDSENILVSRPEKLSTSDHDVILLSDDKYQGASTLSSHEIKEEPLVEKSEAFARLEPCDNKVTLCNPHEVRGLVTRETNASVMNEKDIDLLPVLEKPCNFSDSASLKVKDQEEGTPGKDFATLPNQQSMRCFSQNPSHCTESATISIGKSISDFLAIKDGGYNITDMRSHIKRRQHFGSGKLNDDSIEGKTELDFDCNMTDRGNPATTSPSCTQNNLDRHNRLPKGPRMAKVVRRFNCNVEPLEYGVVLSGNLWSTSQIIFPKGYRSRVRYLSVLDPTKMCYYVSEILDAGLLGPLFMVLVEQCPNEVFIHISANRCWDMVRERVNQEIRRQHNMGRINLPSLQPPGSIDGLEMFGLLSPEIIQAIEALDRDHVCTEYWRSRPQAQATPLPAVTTKGVGPNLNMNERGQGCSPPISSDVVLGGLFKKANPEELHALRNILVHDTTNSSKQQVIQLLSEEI